MPGTSQKQQGAHETQQQQQAAEPRVTITLEDAERLLSVAASPSGSAGALSLTERMQALDRLRAAVAEGEVTGLPDPPSGALSAEFHSRAFSMIQLAWDASSSNMTHGNAAFELLESAYRAMEVSIRSRRDRGMPRTLCRSVAAPPLHHAPALSLRGMPLRLPLQTTAAS